jgi:hypothetical protein
MAARFPWSFQCPARRNFSGWNKARERRFDGGTNWLPCRKVLLGKRKSKINHHEL